MRFIYLPARRLQPSNKKRTLQLAPKPFQVFCFWIPLSIAFLSLDLPFCLFLNNTENQGKKRKNKK